MSFLYQPFTKAMMQRDIPGCLTPEQHQQLITKGNTITTDLIEPPLSPPLSPYQRNAVLHTVALPPPQYTDSKSYLPTSQEFKIENFKDYKLTIEISNSDKGNILRFLDKYSSIINDERNRGLIVPLPVRKYKKRVYESDEMSEETTSRMRTRRVGPRTFETDDEISTPTPKKRRKPATPSSQSPSLALQQQSLIDESIPDFSPNANDTLPQNNIKCLRIEWKGQPMDLSSDPNLSKIHPAEVVLASILRLPVAVYLDSKRRFFFEKVARLKSGKQFRRTDAQKACRIDVNKASRLFAAFEKVGWLKDELFEKYL
ncbi:SWIRM domain-containing protein [Spathaspora sp. JA1]|nr:SWIRM domain-containing protein [Spathaspora sp. JA1]